MSYFRRTRPTFTRIVTWIAAGVFIAFLLAVLFSVVLTAFATKWGASWLPEGLTTGWFAEAIDTPGLVNSIVVTFQVSFAVVAIALIAGVPAGYILARKNFPSRSALMLLLLLPVILPSLTYAVQLAALMYRIGIGGSLLAVIVVNLVPTVPLVILVTVPFVEQISPDVERAARVFGADSGRLFIHVLVPLLVPGIVAAALLAFVRTLAAFDLTFFVSSAKSQTLVVSIFGKLSDPGGPPIMLTAAMTVFYMLFALVGLIVSARFSNPAQTLGRSAA
ncbi:ABC transporter permease [Microbacterium sp. NPDC058389]|uniref:ABC transporter permease n=1 Tax=Microbacterium sp. NPDC058389 TaxID=3346475 RepID=UPI003648CCAA